MTVCAFECTVFSRNTYVPTSFLLSTSLLDTSSMRKAICIHLPLEPSPPCFCPSFPRLNPASSLIPFHSRLSVWHPHNHLLHSNWCMDHKDQVASTNSVGYTYSITYCIIDLIILLKVTIFSWDDVNMNMGHTLSCPRPILKHQWTSTG